MAFHRIIIIVLFRMFPRSFIMLALTSAMLIASQVEGTPLIGECSVNSHCGPSACCLVGFDRYSFPQCSPLGDVGSWCRVMGRPEPKTLAYPNGLLIELQEAYTGFCPCRPGLACSRTSSTCQLPGVTSEEENSLNSLL